MRGSLEARRNNIGRHLLRVLYIRLSEKCVSQKESERMKNLYGRTTKLEESESIKSCHPCLSLMGTQLKLCIEANNFLL